MKTCCSEPFAVREPDFLVRSRSTQQSFGFNRLSDGAIIPAPRPELRMISRNRVSETKVDYWLLAERTKVSSGNP